MSVLVLAEHRRGELREVTMEMLNLADKIAKQNSLQLCTLLLGADNKEFSEKLKPLCDRIISISSSELKNYSPEPYIKAIKSALKAVDPQLIMIAHSASGMDLAPALSEQLSLPLVTDCVDVDLKDKRVTTLRQIYGGKIFSELRLKPFNRYLVTIRPGSFEPAQDLGRSATVTEIPFEAEAFEKRRFLEYIEEKTEDIDISSADILVSIGRGVGKPENIQIVQEFADEIGAVLSCSRPVADKGWLPKSRQVGISGKIVRPKIYIALGISGAFQHQVGMKNSKTIIAVNKDPKAPIFNIAHYGVVADMFQVIPLLKEKLKKDGK